MKNKVNKLLLFFIVLFISKVIICTSESKDLQGVKNKFTSTNVFINGDSDFRLVKEYYDFSNQSGGPSIFEYDKSGKLIKKIFIRSDRLKTVTTYKYNKNGILLTSVRDYGKGKKDVFLYIYNKKRKLIKRLMKRSNGQEGSELYKYSENGELIEAEWKNFDSWLTGIIKFESNKNNKPVKGFFHGEKFKADIIFFYDADKNLIKIYWKFSFGKTQTYTFKYMKIK